MLEKKFVTSLLCLVVVLSFSATGAMGANILFIVADPTEVTFINDILIKDFLESLGHTVTYCNDNASETAMEAAAAAADLVWISESVQSSEFKMKIIEIETPMVVGEPYAWDEMGMTHGLGATVDVATTDITIVNPEHDLAAGFSGTVTVLTDIEGPDGIAELATSDAGGEGTVIATATLSDGVTYDVILVYEKGARLAVAPADGSDQIAADIRIGMFFHYNAQALLNDNAYVLVEAAVNYALGMTPPPELAAFPRPRDGATDVPQEVALTWKPGAYVEGLSPKHRVFFSENFDDVNDGIGGIEQDVARYPIEGSLSLDKGKTCYWRVDEANSTTSWDEGAILRFTVIDHIVVEDFESYNDLDLGDPESNHIYLTWIDGYEQPTNGSIVGHADPPFAERSIVHGGRQSMPYSYNNTGTENYSEAQRTFSPAQDWTREGVDSLALWFRGYPAYVGSFVEAPAGTYTMTASGADIWGTADEFHFAYKEFSGAGSIIAKVESVENTSPRAKAGVMIRDTLDPDSANVLLAITPEKGVTSQNRAKAGSGTVSKKQAGITAPQWVKLERTKGGLTRALYSADGTTWTNLNVLLVRMEMPAYIGLAVTSNNAAATCEAKFSNVSFPDTSVGPEWTDQDIGMLSNVSEPMYVTVGDGSGTAATVYHDNPDAALTSTWTEWNIPLTGFSGQGVVLTDVSKLAIGFGGADNPQPGGSGLVYIDDIRLYLPR